MRAVMDTSHHEYTKHTPPNDDAMPAEIDGFGGKRAQFYKPDVRLIPPVRLEPQVLDFLAKRAEVKGTTLNALLNALLKKDIELIEMAS